LDFSSSCGRGFWRLGWSSVSLVPWPRAACFCQRHGPTGPGFPRPAAQRGGTPTSDPVPLEERLDDHQAHPERGPKAKVSVIGTLFLSIFDVLGKPGPSIAASPKGSQKNHHWVWNLHAKRSAIFEQPHEVLRKFPARSSVLTSALGPSFSLAQRRPLITVPAFSNYNRLAGRSPARQAQCAGGFLADLWPRDSQRADVGRRFTTASRSTPQPVSMCESLGFHQ